MKTTLLRIVGHYAHECPGHDYFVLEDPEDVPGNQIKLPLYMFPSFPMVEDENGCMTPIGVEFSLELGHLVPADEELP